MTVSESVSISTSIQYNENYPPRNAKKAYVAKITGRARGPMKFEREFMGCDVDIFEGDEGLYEKQRGDKKGGYTRWYFAVINHPEYGIIQSLDCEDKASTIAKMLDDGHDINDFIEVTSIDENQRFNFSVRTKAQVKKAVISASKDSSVNHCWEAISLLPQKEAKKVMTLLRKKINEMPDQ